MQITQLKTVIEHYKLCALWASVDRDPKAADDDENPGVVHMEDIHKEWSEEAEKSILVDCLYFCKNNLGLLENWDPKEVGRCLFLSRNGHGAGFFDFPDKGGRVLQESARVYRSSQPYIGDDGKTYLQ